MINPSLTITWIFKSRRSLPKLPLCRVTTCHWSTAVRSRCTDNGACSGRGQASVELETAARREKRDPFSCAWCFPGYQISFPLVVPGLHLSGCVSGAQLSRSCFSPKLSHQKNSHKMRVTWLAKWKGNDFPLTSLSFSIALCPRLFWNSIVLKWTKMNIFSSWTIQSYTLIQKIIDTNIFEKFVKWLHKGTKVSFCVSFTQFSKFQAEDDHLWL